MVVFCIVGGGINDYYGIGEVTCANVIESPWECECFVKLNVECLFGLAGFFLEVVYGSENFFWCGMGIIGIVIEVNDGW